MVDTGNRKGHIVDLSKNPEKVLEGTRYKNVDELEQLVGFLDLWRANQLLSTKKIKRISEYKSPFVIKEHRTYYDY